LAPSTHTQPHHHHPHPHPHHHPHMSSSPFAGHYDGSSNHPATSFGVPPPPAGPSSFPNQLISLSQIHQYATQRTAAAAAAAAGIAPPGVFGVGVGIGVGVPDAHSSMRDRY
jgi:hypothetical protein